MNVEDLSLDVTAVCQVCSWRQVSNDDRAETEAAAHVQAEQHAVLVRQTFVQVYRP